MMRRHQIWLAALALIAVAAIPAPSAAQDSEPLRTMTVKGTGEVSAVPDIAMVSAGVLSQAPTPSAAIAQNNTAVNKVLAAIKEFGIAATDVQTARFQLSPQFRRRRGPGADGQPEIAGYRVSNQVTVRLRALEKLGPLLDSLVANGANQLGGLRFDVAGREALLDTARKRAIADAKRRAALYAAELGASVGRALRVSEVGVPHPIPTRFRALESRAASAIPVAPGEHTLSASVNILFELK